MERPQSNAADDGHSRSSDQRSECRGIGAGRLPGAATQGDDATQEGRNDKQSTDVRSVSFDHPRSPVQKH
jgi:hypothetical protein